MKRLINKYFWEGLTFIFAFAWLFIGIAYQHPVGFMFSGLFAGFFLSLLAYRRIKEYIIDEVIHLIEEKEMEAVKEFVKGLQ